MGRPHPHLSGRVSVAWWVGVPAAKFGLTAITTRSILIVHARDKSLSQICPFACLLFHVIYYFRLFRNRPFPLDISFRPAPFLSPSQRQLAQFIFSTLSDEREKQHVENETRHILIKYHQNKRSLLSKHINLWWNYYPRPRILFNAMQQGALP